MKLLHVGISHIILYKTRTMLFKQIKVLLGCYFLLTGLAFADSSFDKCCGIPHDKVIQCNDLPKTFSPYSLTDLKYHFGFPKTGVGCNFKKAYELTPVVNLNTCGIGTITRKFEIVPTDPWESNFVCEQVIELTGAHDYAIKFPKDAVSTACGVAPTVEGVVFDENACDLLSVSINDERLQASGDRCYKVFRTYRVLNWCEYDEFNTRPIIIGRDEDCDDNPGDEDVWVIKRENGDVFIDVDKNENNNYPSQVDESCGHDGIKGYWRSFSVAYGSTKYKRRGFYQYTQIIKVTDQEPPELAAGEYDDFCSLSNFTCKGPVTIPFSINENCTPDDLEIEVYLKVGDEMVIFTDEYNIASTVLSGSYPNYSLRGDYPIGSHKFIVKARDGCGNSKSLELPFNVIDCVGPSPICLESVSTGLMPVYENGIIVDGMTVIWASDFIRSEATDCSEPIVYSVYKQTDILDKEITPTPDQKSVNITCEDGQFVGVYVYGWDKTGRFDFCESYVRIGNINDICEGPGEGTIVGSIRTFQDQPLQNAEVTITDQEGIETKLMTSDQGEFPIEMALDQTYNLRPRKTDHVKNGVSTMDLIRINKHILGTGKMENPYSIIAADVNDSKTVTTLDMIFIRKIILDIDTAFAKVDSWRFVDASYAFPNTENPFEAPFPESVDITFDGDLTVDANFVAIKMGDTNGNAMGLENSRPVEVRSASTMEFKLAEQFYQAGEHISIPFEISESDQIKGLQFTLLVNKDQFNIENIVPGYLTDLDGFNLTKMEDGMVAFSWHTRDGSIYQEGQQALFNLNLVALADGQLSDDLFISSRLTQAEAYDQFDQIKEVALAFEETNKAKGINQFIPNPLRGQTSLFFHQPSPGTTNVRIFNAQGQQMFQSEKQYLSGNHQLEIPVNNWPKGIYIAVTSINDQIQTDKLIIQ